MMRSYGSDSSVSDFRDPMLHSYPEPFIECHSDVVSGNGTVPDSDL